LADLGWRDPVRVPEPVVEREAQPGPDSPPNQALPPASDTDLEALARMTNSCTRCRLSEQRRTVVFGEGTANARVMFIGEGPGAEEDRTGRPFVGQAGQLLDRMIQSMGFDRTMVYIANVVKCRPPGNRDPKDDEIAACSGFLDRQIDLVGPAVIVALGRFAACRLTGTDKPMGALRGRWSRYRGVPLLPTYHPAYLLRNPSDKRKVWSDLKLVMGQLAE
jgi:uracil-DNA glycosylase family 4